MSGGTDSGQRARHDGGHGPRPAARAPRRRQAGRIAAGGAVTVAAALGAVAVPAVAGAGTMGGTSGGTPTATESCTITGGGLLGPSSGTVTLQVALGATPGNVVTGQTITLNPVVTVTLPFSTYSLLGVQLTAASATIAASDASPSPVTVHGQGLPVAVTYGLLSTNPVTVPMGSVDVTAGTPGTAAFTLGATSFTVVQKGLLGNTTLDFTCAAPASTTVLAQVPVAQKSSVPVGADGAGVLAGVAAVAAIGTGVYRRRWRGLAEFE